MWHAILGIFDQVGLRLDIHRCCWRAGQCLLLGQLALLKVLTLFDSAEVDEPAFP